MTWMTLLSKCSQRCWNNATYRREAKTPPYNRRVKTLGHKAFLACSMPPPLSGWSRMPPSHGVQCHRRGIRCYTRRGRMPRPAASDAIGRGAVCFSHWGLILQAARGAARKIPKVGDCRGGRSARPLQCKSRLEQAAA